MNIKPISTIKNNFLTALLLLIATLSVVLFTVAPTYAQEGPIQEGVKQGSCLSTNPDDCPVTNPNDTINSIIATVINIFSLVVGVVAVIMIIIGGLKYITSGGDSGNVTGAKNTILYAIIGLVVVALAQIIVQFVLNRAVV